MNEDWKYIDEQHYTAAFRDFKVFKKKIALETSQGIKPLTLALIGLSLCWDSKFFLSSLSHSLCIKCFV